MIISIAGKNPKFETLLLPSMSNEGYLIEVNG